MWFKGLFLGVIISLMFGAESGYALNGSIQNPDNGPFVNILISVPSDTDFYSEVCSGTLVTNEWVLTDGHCMYPLVRDGLSVDSPGVRLYITYGSDPDFLPLLKPLPSLAGVSEFTIHPEFLKRFKGRTSGKAKNDDFDVALLHLDRPISVRGSTTDYSMGLYSGPTRRLIGKTVRCYGYGGHGEDGDKMDGQLRTATSEVDKFDGNWIQFDTTDSLGNDGDSGGACIMESAAGPTIVGVIAGGGPHNYFATYWSSMATAPEYFGDWVESVITGKPVVDLPLQVWSSTAKQHATEFKPAGVGAERYLSDLVGQVDLFPDSEVQISDKTGMVGSHTKSSSIVTRVDGNPGFVKSGSQLIPPNDRDWNSLKSTLAIRSSISCLKTKCAMYGTSRTVPRGKQLITNWNPCNNREFLWVLNASVGEGDTLTIGSRVFSGWNGVVTGAATGTIPLKLETIGAIDQRTTGIEDLYAVCKDWDIGALPQ